MSKRAIIDAVSHKKRCHMLPVSVVERVKTVADKKVTTMALETGPATVKGSEPKECLFVFMPTAISNAAGRVVSDPYLVGVKEQVVMDTNDSGTWEWRRICFAGKGVHSAFGDVSLYEHGADGSQRRPVQEVGEAKKRVMEFLFQGKRDKDWMDPLTAAVDVSRVVVKYDKRVTLKSESQGVNRRFNLWHPMGATMHLGDNGMARDIRQGMGDYYIVDIVRNGKGVDEDDFLKLSIEATVYWHER